MFSTFDVHIGHIACVAHLLIVRECQTKSSVAEKSVEICLVCLPLMLVDCRKLVYSGLLWTFLVCSGLLWTFLVCSGLLWTFLVCSVLLWMFLLCFDLLWTFLVSSVLLWTFLVCFGLLWTFLVWYSLIWSASLCPYAVTVIWTVSSLNINSVHYFLDRLYFRVTYNSRSKYKIGFNFSFGFVDGASLWDFLKIFKCQI